MSLDCPYRSNDSDPHATYPCLESYLFNRPLPISLDHLQLHRSTFLLVYREASFLEFSTSLMVSLSPLLIFRPSHYSFSFFIPFITAHRPYHTISCCIFLPNYVCVLSSQSGPLILLFIFLESSLDLKYFTRAKYVFLALEI